MFPIFPLGLLIFCECYRLVGIAQNRFFDEIYLIIYVILFGLLVGVFVYMIALLFYERSVQRKYFRWLMVTAAIIFILMALWVVIYIECIYDKNDQYVYVNGIDRRGQYNR